LTSLPIEHKFDLDRVATSIVNVFPTLDLFEQRLSLELYRSLAEGQPVPRALLAERLSVPVEIVNEVLNGWPGVFSDPQQRVVGYWGLSIPAAYVSPHRLTIDGRRLSAWCAWDTLFLPQLLGQRAEVESASPTPSVTVSLTVTPEEVERIEPAGARMSFLLPDAEAVQKDIVTAFCHFVHFFPSCQAGESWAAQHAGTFLLSIGAAHAVGRRKNEAQYGKVL
jgi:alkylmercury lyase